MDVSGSRTNKYLFLAIIFGVDENIKSLYIKMGEPKTHMTSLSKKARRRIINQLKFDKRNRIAFCVTLNRRMIINNVKNRRIDKYKRVSMGRLYAIFEKTLFKFLRAELEKFTLLYSMPATELSVQCDSDAEVFVRSWGMKRILKPKEAHSVSDAIAFCNRRNRKLSDVIELDYTHKIQTEMVRQFRK